MKTTGWLVLGVLTGIAATAGRAASAADACDRECLRSTMTTFLYALLKHDASKVPVAGNVRVTEDAIEKPLDKVGLFRTVTRLRGYRQDILDERAGTFHLRIRKPRSLFFVQRHQCQSWHFVEHH